MSNIFLYYFITACQSAWFTESVWFFYFRRFADYSTMGIVFAILNIFWIAFELPTGIIADRIGRKFSTLIGTILVTVGMLITAFAAGFWIWVIGLLLQNLGRAFISGALEALVYDDLKSREIENQYPQIAATKSRIGVIVYAVAVIVGGYLGHINLRIPYLIHATLSLFSIIATLYLKENRHRHSDRQALVPTENILHSTMAGLKQFSLPKLKPYLLLSWLLLFIYFVFDWGMTKPAMSVKFGFYEREQGIIFSFTSILVFFTLKHLPKFRQKLSELSGLYLFNFILLLMFLLAIFPLGVIGFIPIMIIETVGSYIDPWISTIMNAHIDSKYRATTLSALQMFGRLPYLAINPIVGFLIDHHQINFVFIFLSVIITLVVVLNYFLTIKSNSYPFEPKSFE